MKTAALAVLLAALCLQSGAAPLYGDANNDGSIDARDAGVALRIAAGLSPLTEPARRNADVAPLNDFEGGSFGDGRITLGDAVRLLQRVAAPNAPNWPAVRTGYLLEVGNVYTFREYDAAGQPRTGPGTSSPDDVNTITRTQSETVGGQTYTAYISASSDGSEQHFVNTTCGGQKAIGITQGTFGGTNATFDPPLIALVYPMEAGRTWSGTTTTMGLTATYEGRLDGPESVITPAGTFTDAFRATVTYSAPVYPGINVTGYEKVWFVPFVGPVQRGYSKTVPFQGTTTVDPQAKLATANVHGVLWP